MPFELIRIFLLEHSLMLLSWCLYYYDLNLGGKAWPSRNMLVLSLLVKIRGSLLVYGIDPCLGSL